jgi:hypothetical protein
MAAAAELGRNSWQAVAFMEYRKLGSSPTPNARLVTRQYEKCGLVFRASIPQDNGTL